MKNVSINEVPKTASITVKMLEEDVMLRSIEDKKWYMDTIKKAIAKAKAEGGGKPNFFAFRKEYLSRYYPERFEKDTLSSLEISMMLVGEELNQ